MFFFILLKEEVKRTTQIDAGCVGIETNLSSVRALIALKDPLLVSTSIQGFFDLIYLFAVSSKLNDKYDRVGYKQKEYFFEFA
tara:strand:+ start:329 stop:577 length:249 start_codon:yes stop_codon:yes gene_type:complete